MAWVVSSYYARRMSPPGSSTSPILVARPCPGSSIASLRAQRVSICPWRQLVPLQVKNLCEKAREILVEESNVQVR